MLKYLIKERDQWNLKSKEDLGINDWFKYYQLYDQFMKDKRDGFSDRKSELESIFDKGNKGLLSRLYKYILEYKLEDNRIKTMMISWAKDFGKNIELVKWEYLWKREFKFTVAGTIRENMYKMFYRSYISQ